MTASSLLLHQADDDTIGYVKSLVDENDLPSRDVTAHPDRFYIGYDGDTRVGVGGVETYGTDGLLRSVVVKQSVRGNGLGTELCAALEATAAADGVERLYLLTTTAAAFFRQRGYVEIERGAAPAAIQQTSEFDDLCPTTATCMKTSLEDGRSG
jgi:amino-acid N-acetyltransferase